MQNTQKDFQSKSTPNIITLEYNLKERKEFKTDNEYLRSLHIFSYYFRYLGQEDCIMLIDDNEVKFYKKFETVEDEQTKILKPIIGFGKHIVTIKMRSGILLNNACKMFDHCSSLIKADFSKFNSSRLTDTSYMFYKCRSLKSINLNGFNTSNVNNMKSMFGFCINLTELNVDSFNTSYVQDMSGMFALCTKLKQLDIKNFRTNNVIFIRNIFCECISLTLLNISNFNTRNIKDMFGIFLHCRNLINLFLPVNIELVKNLTNECTNLNDCVLLEKSAKEKLQL